MARRWSVLVGLLVPLGCGSSSTPTDSGPDRGVDRSSLDGRPDGGRADARVDAMRPDTGPKPPAKWTATGNMQQARTRHSLTLLEDGTVLAVGGLWSPPSVGYKGIASAERFDPKNGTWAAAGEMSGPHFEHEAVRLKDGKVLIIGGCGDELSNVCMIDVGVELYDPKAATNAWKKMSSMFADRRSHRAALLNDGRVFVAGGFDNKANLTSVELFDPTGGTWSSPAAALSTPRNLATATTLKSGKVIIAGGYDGDKPLGTVEIFDPSTGSLQLVTATFKEPRAGHRAALLNDGRVLFAGGFCDGKSDPGCVVNNAELYDPATDKMSVAGTPSAKTIDHTATLLADGRVLVVGGLMKPKVAVLFDAVMMAWTQTAAPNELRHYHAAAPLADGRAIVCGGEDVNGDADVSAEIYNP
jgi:N-acetylneuraminic acid mutarotase